MPHLSVKWGCRVLVTQFVLILFLCFSVNNTETQWTKENYAFCHMVESVGFLKAVFFILKARFWSNNPYHCKPDEQHWESLWPYFSSHHHLRGCSCLAFTTLLVLSDKRLRPWKNVLFFSLWPLSYFFNPNPFALSSNFSLTHRKLEKQNSFYGVFVWANKKNSNRLKMEKCAFAWGDRVSLGNRYVGLQTVCTRFKYKKSNMTSCSSPLQVCCKNISKTKQRVMEIWLFYCFSLL